MSSKRIARSLEELSARLGTACPWPLDTRAAMLDWISDLRHNAPDDLTLGELAGLDRLSDVLERRGTRKVPPRNVRISLHDPDAGLALSAAGAAANRGKGEASRAETRRLWKSLNMPEYNRASVIANRRGISPRTVRLHVADLRKRERRQQQ